MEEYRQAGSRFMRIAITGYFEATEVLALMVALLQIVDNPD